MFQKLRQKQEEQKKLREQMQSQPSAFDDAIISWVAPESMKHERGKTWRMVMLGAVIVFAIGGIIYNAITFSLAIITFAFVYYLLMMENPKDIEIKISNVGIKVGGRRYSYGEIKAFWIIYEPPHFKTLNLKIQNNINSDVVIQLNDQNPAEVRDFLIKRIPEMQGGKENFSEILARIFKI
jgi:Ca2+-dependent lipid-binding protein